MIQRSNNDIQRTEQIQGIQRKITERHYSLPSGILSQGQIEYFASGLNLALWTDAGGIVACSDENFAASIAEVIAGHADQFLVQFCSGVGAKRARFLVFVSLRAKIHWRGICGNQARSKKDCERNLPFTSYN
jgi:hypothetical protein